MNVATREILDETMVRRWGMWWAQKPVGESYDFQGTATEAVLDFNRRYDSAVVRHRIVMDDGDWTIRGYFRDGSVGTIGVAY